MRSDYDFTERRETIMALFWGKYWKTKAEAKKMRTSYARGRGTIRKTKQGWGIYSPKKQ
jgi:hypothetical protein